MKKIFKESGPIYLKILVFIMSVSIIFMIVALNAFSVSFFFSAHTSLAVASLTEVAMIIFDLFFVCATYSLLDE